MSDKETKCKCEKALEFAERVRQFEIELYWKRSAYFWTFIALAFAGYGALQVNGGGNFEQENLDFLLANVGFVASAAWFLVNRGSKYWQEHWETQVDRLENCVTGPLYKAVIARNAKHHRGTFCRILAKLSLKQWMTGAARLPAGDRRVERLRVTSVSKINQLSGLYVMMVWIILGWKACPWTKCCNDWLSAEAAFGLLTLVSLGSFWWLGKTKPHNYCYTHKTRSPIPTGPVQSLPCSPARQGCRTVTE